MRIPIVVQIVILQGFDRIRRIQEGLQERAKIASWPVVDPTWGSDTERIKHFLNLAWNEHKRDYSSTMN